MPNQEPACARTLPLCGKTFGFIFSAVTGQILSRNFSPIFWYWKFGKFFPNFSQIYNEKKNSQKTTKCLPTKLNDPMCVMKVALQRFAYIDALY
jgi:hypothetical protein